MGVDLTLLPMDACSEDCAFSHSVLGMDRDRELFEKIEKLVNHEGTPVPNGFNSYLSTLENGESGYGETLKDDYDQRIKYVTARKLYAVMPSHYATLAVLPSRYFAIMQYISALPEDTKIALYWR